MTTLSQVAPVKIRVIDTIPMCYDYDEEVFLNLPINRTLKKPHILKLVKGFRLVHPTFVSVLIVIKTRAWNEDPKDLSVEPQLYLCDGHNRRQAALIYAKELGEPVALSFHIVEIDGEDTIQNVGKLLETINVNLGTWTPSDYKGFRAETGHEDYRKYSNLKETYKLGDSDMLQILGLGQYTMAQFKGGAFRIDDMQKSQAILDVISTIGLNNRKTKKTDGFPHTHVKRTLLKKLTSLNTNKIIASTYKFQAFLETDNFSYDEIIFKAQLDHILS